MYTSFCVQQIGVLNWWLLLSFWQKGNEWAVVIIAHLLFSGEHPVQQWNCLEDYVPSPPRPHSGLVNRGAVGDEWLYCSFVTGVTRAEKQIAHSNRMACLYFPNKCILKKRKGNLAKTSGRYCVLIARCRKCVPSSYYSHCIVGVTLQNHTENGFLWGRGGGGGIALISRTQKLKRSRSFYYNF